MGKVRGWARYQLVAGAQAETSWRPSAEHHWLRLHSGNRHRDADRGLTRDAGLKVGSGPVCLRSRVDELFGDLRQFAVGAGTLVLQDREGALGTDLVPLHQDALGLPDHVPTVDGLMELLRLVDLSLQEGLRGVQLPPQVGILVRFLPNRVCGFAGVKGC